jgi:FkbM family methyltransferase
MLRRLLERATRKSTFRRRLPAAAGGGPIVVSGSAGLKYLLRSMDEVDPALVRLAREFVRPGHVVWDIGANIGLFAFAAAHLAGVKGKVFAFEPDVWLVQLLRRSAALQSPGSASVDIIPAAVARACELRTFHIAARSRATNSLAGYGHAQTGGVAETQTVLTVTLDWLAAETAPPDVLKIDVEGAELEVLRGGVELLRGRNPVLLCEVGADSSPEISALLHDLGYRLYDGECADAQRPEVDRAPWNTIALRR